VFLRVFFRNFDAMRKGARGGKAGKNTSKWTPDISIDGNGGNDRDDAEIERLGGKLGVKDVDDVPPEFVADGLDYLLKLPKYGQDARNVQLKAERKQAIAALAAQEAEPEVVKAPKRSKGDAVTRKRKQQEAEEEQGEEEQEEDDEDDEDEGEAGEEEIANPEEVMEALKRQKAARAAARPPSEIDAIFGKLQSGKKGEKKAAKTEPRKSDGKRDDGFAGRSMPGKGRKYTEEGYPVYTEEELGLNKAGGDTPDCPFDCNCCF
jgi:hypothetical protein